MSIDELYFGRLAAAYVRGMLDRGDDRPLDQLSPLDLEALIQRGQTAGLRLHRFKRTMGLPRVTRTLGILRGLAPSALLDIGSGRGAALWPILDAFPALPITAIDRLPHRVSTIQAVRAGGIDSLTTVQADVLALPFATDGVDVVTMLEVLEHIPNAERALHEAVRVGRRFLVLSVPSRADDNPEHVHLFSAERLTSLLQAAGARRVTIDGVHNHLLAIARLGSA